MPMKRIMYTVHVQSVKNNKIEFNASSVRSLEWKSLHDALSSEDKLTMISLNVYIVRPCPF